MWKSLLLVALAASAAVGHLAAAPRVQTLAFISNQDGIRLVDEQGKHVRAVPGTGSAFDFSWSPDGRRLAFTASGSSGGADIWIAAVGGKDVRRLTRNHVSSGPVWARDGSQIFYSSVGGEWSVRPDGTGAHRLPRDHAPIGSWSPDGTLVAAAAKDSKGRFQIWVARADGTQERQLTNNTKPFLEVPYVSFSDPAWSPDGQTLAYTRETSRGDELDLMQSDGTQMRRLVRSDAVPFDAPAWSPDGAWIAFTRNTSHDTADLFLIHPDGSGVRRLTHGASAFSPSWRPQH